MRVHYMVGALLTAALITGCQTSTAADEEAVREMVAAFDAAFNTRDADALLAAVYTDESTRMSANEPTAQGRDAIRASFLAAWEAGESNVDNHVAEIHILGDLAAARGTWTARNVPSDGSEPYDDRGSWAGLYRRAADGSWKVVWDIWNSELPPRLR